MTAGLEYGTVHSMQCDGSLNDNSGCGVGANSSAQYTFGTPFSHHSGGVYATEWTSSHIRIWYFPSGAIPSDIIAGKPRPTEWDLPRKLIKESLNTLLWSFSIAFSLEMVPKEQNADFSST